MPSLDHSIIVTITPLINSNLGDIWASIADMAGNGGLQALLAVLLFLAGWYFHKKNVTTCALSCLFGLAVSGILVQLLKFAIGRGRPDMGLPAWTFRPWAFGNDWHSFPSGHAASTFSIATVLSAFYPTKWWLWYAVASFIGIGRVLGESHFPTDVLAGALLGSLCGGLCIFLALRYFPEK